MADDDEPGEAVAGEPADTLVLALHAERLQVATAVRRTGEVIVRVETETGEQELELPLLSRRVGVERRPVNRIVDVLPTTRREGATTIVPIVEEVVVTRYRIVEEIHLVEIDEIRTHRETVTLRSERAVIMRDGKTI